MKKNKAILNILLVVVVVALFFVNFTYMIVAYSDENDIVSKKRELSSLIRTDKKSECIKMGKNIVSLAQDKTSTSTFEVLKYKNLDFIGDKVRLEVILTNEGQLKSLSEFNDAIEIENHYNALAQILLPVDQIIDLSKENYV